MADPSQGASAAQPWEQQGYAAPATGVVGRTTPPGRQILLTIVTLGIWAYVWVYRQHEDIKLYTGEGVGGGLGVIIFFFVSPFISSSAFRRTTFMWGSKPSRIPR